MNFKMDQNAQAARQAYGAGVSDLVDEKEPSKEEKNDNVGVKSRVCINH